MKKRNGFVSNSSSSSFIIRVDTPEGKYYFDNVLKKLQNKHGDDISRSTGYYTKTNLVLFANTSAIYNSESSLVKAIRDSSEEYGVGNIALCMFSDEDEECSPYPEEGLHIWSGEYH